MIRIIICCGGGFSSSALATRMQKELVNRGMDNEYNIVFRPFHDLAEKHDDCDVAMLCPHLLHGAKRYIEENDVDFPIYMIPTRIYGLMTVDTIVEDAEDIIAIYKEKHENLAHFEGEDNPLLNHRTVSYRRTHKL